jgi:hypothetical protein
MWAMRAGAVSLPSDVVARETSTAELSVPLAGGAQTTAHVAIHSLADTEVRAVLIRRPEPLSAWCARRAIGDAISGGFFVRATGRPLGELRTRGIRRRTTAFLSPWDSVRACVHVHAHGGVAIARRDELPARPRGDLLQAGPLLVAGGEPIGSDAEGFSAGSAQFDSDITAGRYPRAALGVTGDRLLAVAIDGRGPRDAGMTIAELAAFMAGLGAESALNLDGGGSAALVSDGRMVNRPREQDGTPLVAGRPIVSALTFLPRTR